MPDQAQHRPSRPRIALVRSRYNPAGGAERFIESVLGALSGASQGDQDPQFTVLCREWLNNSPSQQSQESTTTRRIVNPPYYGSWWRDASFALAVKLIIQQGEFDCVQSHERIAGCHIFRAGDGLHAAWLARRRRAFGAAERWRQRLNPHHGWLVAEEAAMFRHPNLQAVICNSQMVRAELIAAFPDQFSGSDTRLKVIYNAVDLARFNPKLRDTERLPLRQALAIPADAFVWLQVGSGFQRKGVQQTLQALAAQHQSASAAYLVVAGSDKHLARYRALAATLGLAERVRFTGAVSLIEHYYAMADAFVLPTLYDPCPNAAFEALASGLPIVVSADCGAKELVQSGVNGEVVDLFAPSSQRALSQAMQQVRERGTPCAAARASVQHLSASAMAQIYRDLYQAVHMRLAATAR